MKTHALIYLTACCLALSSCCRKRVPTQERVEQHSDSLSIRETLRQIKVFTPRERVVFETQIPITLPKPYSFSTKTGHTTATINITPDGKLTGECLTDSLEHVIFAKDREIQNLQKRSSKETKVVTVKESKWYDIAARCLLLIILALIAIRIVLKRLLIL